MTHVRDALSMDESSKGHQNPGDTILDGSSRDTLLSVAKPSFSSVCVAGRGPSYTIWRKNGVGVSFEEGYHRVALFECSFYSSRLDPITPVYFFWLARVSWPLLCLCHPFCIFERCFGLEPRELPWLDQYPYCIDEGRITWRGREARCPAGLFPWDGGSIHINY